jgi:hypothetical protein
MDRSRFLHRQSFFARVKQINRAPVRNPVTVLIARQHDPEQPIPACHLERNGLSSGNRMTP